MLEVRGLRFAYKRDPVLRGLDFSADTGQCVCVLGENGAGKTTLFRCLLGLLRGYQGGITVGGADARQLSTREMAEKVAYIPQAHSPAFNYTAFQTVLMGTHVHTGRWRSPGGRERAVAWEMLDLMRISALAGRGCAELSGGERQLVLIARALAQLSPILLMDEPTANLDYGNQIRVMAQARRLADGGYLVLMSTHNPEHALRYADAVLALKGGRALAYGRPSEVLTPSVIGGIYGVVVERLDVAAPWGSVPVIVPDTSAEPRDTL
jgi:iron complex transport system ATP-binding protein